MGALLLLWLIRPCGRSVIHTLTYTFSRSLCNADDKAIADTPANCSADRNTNNAPTDKDTDCSAYGHSLFGEWSAGYYQSGKQSR